MSSVKLSSNLVSEAKIRSKVFNRSVAGQIEYWAKIGKLVEENSDLPYPFIIDILIGEHEAQTKQILPFHLPSKK
jgi:ParD-like antitoxin of type II bacterial toxin-antitoxin system